MGFLHSSSRHWVFVFCFVVAGLKVAADGEVIGGTAYIDGNTVLGITDEDFICATLDWWPPEKCDYGRCSWGNASILNLDLSNQILLNAVKAFSPLKIRLGGSLQDKVVYETPESTLPCLPFARNDSKLFGFSEGCLPMARWDSLNSFFQETRASVIFGLNALTGRTKYPNGQTSGAWNHINAASFINYTVFKNYIIHGWEFGNELCGSGVGARVNPIQYAYDTISLQNVVQKLYADVDPKPMVISPGGFFDQNWFASFLQKAGESVDAVTHHIYNLGPGVSDHLVDNILSPETLDREAITFRNLRNTVRNSASSAVAWVGEAGGAYNSGGNHVSNAFVDSFWYLHQLGMASAYDTKTYCRQSLIGGNYGLLNTTTFEPNPDYYSALLWHRLMGRKALATSISGTDKVRTFAHCAKWKGVTLLVINFERSATVEVSVAFNSSYRLQHKHRAHHSRNSRRGSGSVHPGEKKIDGGVTRSEYHLTAKDGDLRSQIMVLNGKDLRVDSMGNLPALVPNYVDTSQPVSVAPLSIAFVRMPFLLPACGSE